MKRNLIILIFIGVFITVACNNTKPEENGIKIIEIDLDQAKHINLTEWFDSIQLIPLETNDQSLIATKNYASISEDSIYIYDQKMHCILVFDHNNGKFIKTTSHLIGQGPNEYISINDFDIDERNGDILLLSSGVFTINRYNANLELTNKYKLTHDLIPYGVFKSISNDIFLFINGKEEDEELINVFSVKENKVIKKTCPSVMGVVTKTWSSLYYFIENKDQLSLVTTVPYSYIYRFDSTKLEFSPKVEFKIKQNRSFDILPKQDRAYYNRLFNSQEYAFITDILENKRYFLTTIRYRGKAFTNRYDKVSGKSQIFEYQYSDTRELFYAKLIDDDALYVFRDLEHISPLSNSSFLDDKYKKMIGNASEDDNPFIIKFFFKDF